MPNVRIIAKGQRGDSLTKLKVTFAPEQSSTPSLMPETNSVYLTRPTEGTGELMELVGGSVGWNQLVQNGNFASTAGWSTNVYSLSASDNVLTVTIPSVSAHFQLKQVGLVATQNHKYLVGASINPSFAIDNFAFRINSATLVTSGDALTANTWNRWCKVFNAPSGTEPFTLYTAAGSLSAGTIKVRDVILCDLTQMLGPTIADYVYSLEQATAGSGIAWLKSYGFFTEDYIPYSAPTMQSVEATSHVTKDANNTTIATYPLDNITLRGIPKLNNGNLYYDGDTYEWDGTVTRKYGYRAYQSGDASDGSTMITDGSHTVYKLNTPTTESADPFTAVQTVEDGGTEEFVTTNGVPVGVVGRFANAVPMEGVDSFTVTADDGTTHTYPVTLSEKIYRGYVDMLTGEAVSDMASIAEYNGETINAPWLSSLDVYSLGATPTRGAQVVYPITAEEITATITGDPTELGKVTSASSTEGTVEWSAMAPLDGKCIVRVVS